MNRNEFLRIASRGAAASVAACSMPAFAGQAEPSRPPSTSAVEAHAGPSAGVTSAVVRFIATSRLADFMEPAQVEAKRCLVDGFGVILAGSTVTGSRVVRQYVKSCGADGQATVLGPEPFQASAAQAALANGASGHAMDYDDTQLSASSDRVFGLLTHPTVPALAASLAVGERLGVSGAAFLEAFLTGFDVECKLAEAIDPNHYLRGFHSSGTIGTFGAVVSAAKLLALSPAQAANALGIAASMSSGIRVNFGSMTKPLHVGRAAENGVTAAELAAGGFTAGADALDGQWGFLQVFGGGADAARIVPALGRPLSIVSPGVSFKPYPCGSLGHPTMDAMKKLVIEHDVRPEQIKRIRIRAASNILKPLRYATAKTELEAKFCLPFMVSSIALRRRAGIHEFTDEFVSSAPVQAMIARVDLIFDPAIEARGFDKMRSVVEIDLVSGNTLVQPSDDRYRGGPERPFTRDELHQKFTECAALLLPGDRIRQALELIESIDQLANVRELTRVLTPAASN